MERIQCAFCLFKIGPDFCNTFLFFISSNAEWKEIYIMCCSTEAVMKGVERNMYIIKFYKNKYLWMYELLPNMTTLITRHSFTPDSVRQRGWKVTTTGYTVNNISFNIYTRSYINSSTWGRGGWLSFWHESLLQTWLWTRNVNQQHQYNSEDKIRKIIFCLIWCTLQKRYIVLNDQYKTCSLP